MRPLPQATAGGLAVLLETVRKAVPGQERGDQLPPWPGALRVADPHSPDPLPLWARTSGFVPGPHHLEHP